MKAYTLSGGQTRRKRWSYFFVVLVVLGVYLFWTLGRPLPTLRPTVNGSVLTAQAPTGNLAWPAQGQSAVGIIGSSVLETHGKQQPVPTASTAKMITALVVLQQKPLKAGEQGPTITLTANDVAIYNAYMSRDGSLVKVQAGEQISEYQMLQAILLPSANNIADSLAIWAFGSLKNYSRAANQYLEDQGLVESHVGSDASGFNPSTTSTAEDLARIGELVMRNPVLAQIVAQPTVGNFPVVNNIKNVNFLLGTSHIIGVKTGNTDQAGGVYVSASRINVNNKPVTIVTALAGSPTLFQSLKDSLTLVQSAQANFKSVKAATGNSVVATYQQPWGGAVKAVAVKDLSLGTWAGSTITAKAHLQPVETSSRAGQTVGSLIVPKSAYNNELSAPVKLQAAPTKPSVWWRLTHPL